MTSPTVRAARPKIIAEIAQGYEGRPDYCDFYVRAAARAGADAVKFQIVYADDVAEPGYEYYDWYKQLEMPVEAWRAVRDRAAAEGIPFLANLSGERAAAIAEAIGPDGITIHASNFFNRPLIKRAFDAGARVFIYLGGIEIDEIDRFCAQAADWNVLDRLVLMYGFQAEPTPIEKSGVARLPLLRRRFPDVELGYLDHAAGGSDDIVHISILAMALGANWIEKHLTLSRYMEVEDFVSALEPDEFATYVETLHRVSTAIGPEETKLNEDERLYRDKSVKKIFAAVDLDRDTVLAEAHLAFRRSARIAPFAGFHDPVAIIGQRVVRPIAAGDPILAEDVQ